ncbi:glycosyltransferase family 39 protein [candidate division KSB1 bacterium]|nr:glycosyltransferase family 39 protein [candidate division KSB1 bacterium]
MLVPDFKKLKPETIFLFVILSVSALLRFYGIQFGMPFKYHPDEVKLVTQAGLLLSTKFMAKDAFFAFGIYPLFYTILLSVLMGGFIFIAVVTGYFESFEYAKVFYEQQSFTFILIGRYFVAVLGIISVYVLYKILRELYSKKIAYIGSVLLAVNFVHVRNSHFSTVDIPATFCALVAIYFSAKILTAPKRKYYILSAIFIACAVAAKYSLFLVVLPFLYAHIVQAVKSKPVVKRLFGANIFISFFTGFITFLLFCPLFVLDLNRTLHGLGRIQTFEKIGKIGSGGGLLSYWTGDQSPGFGVFYPNSIPTTFGVILTLFIILGLALQIIRHRKADILLLLFVVPTYIFFEELSYKAMRHILPIIPLLMVSGAIGIVWVSEKLFKKEMLRYAALTGIVAGIVISGSAGSFHYLKMLNRVDPRTRALEWVTENINMGTAIAVESFPPYLPGLFSEGGNDNVYFITRMNLWDKVSAVSDSLSQMLRDKTIQYYIADGFTRQIFEWKYTRRKYPDIVSDRQKLFTWLDNNAEIVEKIIPKDENIQPFIIIYKMKY